MDRSAFAALLVAILIVTSVPVAGLTHSHKVPNNNTVTSPAPCGDLTTVDKSTRSCLVRTYSPILHFTADENYRPTSIKKFVDEATVGVTDKDVSLKDLPHVDSDLEIESEQYTYPHSDLPRIVYASIHTGVEFTPPNSVIPKEYVAVTFWTFYFHDDKAALRDKFGEESITSINPEEHQSDFESVTILVNSSGAQWVGASQHLGGELRPWDAVQTQNGTHPRLYIAEGAHSIYFTNTGQYDSSGILGQEHHLNSEASSTKVPILGGWMSQKPSWAKDAVTVYTDVTGNASTWSRNGEGIHYEVRTLTGDEPWQDFEGSFTDSELSQLLIGDAIPPAQRDRWKSSGAWMKENLVYYDTQVHPKLGWQFHGFDKGSLNESSVTVTPKIRNIGPQPGTIYTRITIMTPNGTVVGQETQAFNREAGMMMLSGKEEVQVELNAPVKTVNVKIEAFLNEPDEDAKPVTTLTGEICSDLLECYL